MASEIKKTSWLSGKKTYCLVTGASRGIGREIAKQFAANVGEGSILFLVARNTALLEVVKLEIVAESPKVKVSLATYDLGKPDAGSFKTIIEDSLSENGSVPGDFQQVVVVHNAAATSTPRLAVDYIDPVELEEHFTLNVVSPICLNNVFLKVFHTVHEKLVVNLTSIAAIFSLPTISVYCSGKAGREMYFKTLATEEPDVVVCQYGPGPVDTQMLQNIRIVSKTVYPQTSRFFQGFESDGMLLDCKTTTKKLLSILQEGKFTSGSHLDIYSDDIYNKYWNAAA